MGVLSSILEVFSGVGEWIASSVQDLIPMFYVAGEGGTGQLTFLGVLACAGLAFSVIFLIMRIIQNFMHFRS